MESFNVRPLEYSYKTPSGDGGSTCLLAIGVCAVLFFMMMNNNQMRQQTAMFPRAMHNGVMSMLGQMTGGHSKHPPGMKSATSTFSEFSSSARVSLIDGDESAKQANEQALRDFVNDDSKSGCIVFFAHWCPHCKTMISKIAEVANANPNSDVRFVLVNAESVMHTAFVGEGAVYELKYYPTVVCKIGTQLTQVSGPEEVMESIVSQQPQQPPVESEEQVSSEGEMLSKLF